MNRDLITRIRDIVRAAPQSFDMSNWEDPHPCGTARCIAGWAVHLATGKPLYTRTTDGLHGYVLDPSVMQLAGTDAEGRSEGSIIQAAAANLLGLGFEEAHEVFFSSNGRALLWLDRNSNDTPEA